MATQEQFVGETIGHVAIEHDVKRVPDDLVPFAHGRAPATYTATLKDTPGPVRISVAIERGRPDCVAVERTPGGPALTGAFLRSLPLERILRETSWMVAYEERLFTRADWDDYQRWAAKVTAKPAYGKPPVLPPTPIPLEDHPDDPTSGEYVRHWMPIAGRHGGLDQLRAVKRHRPRRGARLSDDLLENVARVYRAHSNNPTAAVAETLHIARSTAGRYVARARARGFLGPAIGPKAGESA